MPQPEFDKALQHNTVVLADPELTPEDRADALLQQAECLSQLDRFDEPQSAGGRYPMSTRAAAAVACC